MDTGLEGGKGHTVLVVDISNDGHRGAGYDPGQSFCGLDLVAGATDNIGTRHSQLVDLLEGSVDIGRPRDRHRLDTDRRIPANGHVTDHDLPGRAPRKCGLDLHRSGGYRLSKRGLTQEVKTGWSSAEIGEINDVPIEGKEGNPDK